MKALPAFLSLLLSVSAHAAPTKELRPLFRSQQPIVQSNMQKLSRSYNEFLKRPNATALLSNASKFVLTYNVRQKGELGYFGNAPRSGLLAPVIDFPVFLQNQNCAVYGHENNAPKAQLQGGQDYSVFAKYQGPHGLDIMLVSPYSRQGVLFVSCKAKSREALDDLNRSLSGLFEVNTRIAKK